MPSSRRNTTTPQKDHVVLGIDPGLRVTGFGVIEGGKYVDCGIIDTGKHESFCKKLSCIYESMERIIEKHRPDSIAMEEVFMNVNPKASKNLIMGRTAAFLACCNGGYEIYEYSPSTIKKNITGNGHASKETVYDMVQRLIGKRINNHSRTSDSADAIAVALCHFFSLSLLSYRSA
jgi:crossover junction endodeoxyribonuclease RuvC